MDRINFKFRSDFSWVYRMIRYESRIPRWSTIVVEALVELVDDVVAGEAGVLYKLIGMVPLLHQKFVQSRMTARF